MAFRLPRLPRSVAIVNPKGEATIEFQRWWQSVVEALEVQETTQDGLLDEISDILGLTSDLEAAIEDVEDIAAGAAADAATAQAAADAAQAAVDAIEVPPTGSRTVSSDTALTSDDYTVLVDASGGVVTITLPPAPAAQNSIVVTKIDASANAVDVEPAGADNINGGASPISITTQYASRTLNSDGTSDWYG